MEFGGQARLAAAGVTVREAEVLSAVGERLTNQEVAERLCVSVRTVESHVSALLRKLALPGRPALIRLARQLAAEPGLPLPPTSFLGREEEMVQLRTMLGTAPLVCITGPAGCGKTRLALEAAGRWTGEARIAGLAAAAASDVGAVISAALGLGFEAADLASAARVALAGRRVLLVVDDCDQVIVAAAEQLTALVRAVPDLRVVATSRQPLGLSDELVLPLKPLACPAACEPAAVEESPAGRLFLDRARAASPEFRLDEATAPPVADICRRLDGLPLAIELAASRVRTLDLATLAGSLATHLRLLERPAGAGRHRSLGAAIEWSWQLLSQAEQDLLGRLAALPGDFTLAVAVAVTPARPAADVEADLLGLADRSLVSVTVTGGPARYRLLETIRAYAAARGGETEAYVRHQHARYCCELAQAEVRDRRQSGPIEPPADLDETDYLAALSWAEAHEPILADRLLRLVAQMTSRRPSRRGIEVMCAVARTDHGPWSSEALAWATLAATYLDLTRASDLAARSAARAGNDRDLAYARWVAGWVHSYRHEEAAALECLDQVIAYAQHAAEGWLEASAWQARGLARPRAEDAFRDWERAALGFAAADDPMHANNVRYMMAHRAVEVRERLGEVPVWLRECETFAARHGNRHELAHIHLVQAKYEQMQGRLATARDLLDGALPVFRQAGDLRCVTRTLLELAEYHRTGDPAAATELLLQGLGTASLAGGGSLRTQVLASLTTAAAKAGDLPLSARALGALDSLVRPQVQSGSTNDGPTVSDDLISALQQPAYAVYVQEGRVGGINLITTLYPR